jgi:signal transduction histidine kinase
MPRLKDTKIKIKLENDSHLEIQTYVNELIQVVLNILNNAIDELISSDIKKPTIIIKIEDIEDNVKIHIIDNANGISESVIERIFEPYFSTKGKNGTGLGLYMSQMIMQKQFNSKIEVKSSKKGSTFTITVPKELS